MNEVRILHMIIYTMSTLGILLGLDLLSGANITSFLKKTLDRKILDVDQLIVKMTSSFRKIVDTSIDIDKKIITTKARIVLGFIVISTSVVMLLLANRC